MNLFKKLGVKLQKAVSKSKMLVSVLTVGCMSSMLAVTCFAADEVPATEFDVSGAIAGIGPKFLDAFGLIITACIDLAVGMIPIGLAFIGAVLLIKKGKSLLTKTV